MLISSKHAKSANCHNSLWLLKAVGGSGNGQARPGDKALVVLLGRKTKRVLGITPHPLFAIPLQRKRPERHLETNGRGTYKQRHRATVSCETAAPTGIWDCDL